MAKKYTPAPPKKGKGGSTLNLQTRMRVQEIDGKPIQGFPFAAQLNTLYYRTTHEDLDPRDVLYALGELEKNVGKQPEKWDRGQRETYDAAIAEVKRVAHAKKSGGEPILEEVVAAPPATPVATPPVQKVPPKAPAPAKPTFERAYLDDLIGYAEALDDFRGKIDDTTKALERERGKETLAATIERIEGNYTEARAQIAPAIEAHDSLQKGVESTTEGGLYLSSYRDLNTSDAEFRELLRGLREEAGKAIQRGGEEPSKTGDRYQTRVPGKGKTEPREEPKKPAPAEPPVQEGYFVRIVDGRQTATVAYKEELPATLDAFVQSLRDASIPDRTQREVVESVLEQYEGGRTLVFGGRVWTPGTPFSNYFTDGGTVEVRTQERGEKKTEKRRARTTTVETKKGGSLGYLL